MFASLDDILRHVEEVKTFRKAKLNDSGLVLQRLLRWLRESGLLKASTQADVRSINLLL
jgi:hypothetical protein